MRKKIIILFLLSSCLCAAAQEASDSLDDFRQHTTWGFVTGPNILNYSLNLESTTGSPDRSKPGLGAELGLFLDYHISEPWAIRFIPSAGMEHVNLYKGDDDGHLFTFAIEMAMALEYTHPLHKGSLNVAAGPYSHFVLASTLYGSDNLTNPYSRTTASDPYTEQPTFAMGDLGAGLLFFTAYELPSAWFIQVDVRYGITDMLNADSHCLYVRPFKAVIAFGRRFR